MDRNIGEGKMLNFTQTELLIIKPSFDGIISYKTNHLRCHIDTDEALLAYLTRA